MEKILRNMAQCKLCDSVIESISRHDYITCACGAIAVDGGKYYLRRTGNPEDIIELSEVTKDDWYDYIHKTISS